MQIGKIARSNSQFDYVVQVYRDTEAAQTPTSQDYAFGTLVKVRLRPATLGDLIGIIYNTVLVNPEFGSLGPRLSPEPVLKVFMPDYLNEKLTMVGVLMLGILPPVGKALQGIPYLTADMDEPVEVLEPAEIRRFHAIDNRVRLGYLPFLLSQSTPQTSQLALSLLLRLAALFPEQTAALTVLRNQIAWKVQVQAML